MPYQTGRESRGKGRPVATTSAHKRPIGERDRVDFHSESAEIYLVALSTLLSISWHRRLLQKGCQAPRPAKVLAQRGAIGEIGLVAFSPGVSILDTDPSHRRACPGKEIDPDEQPGRRRVLQREKPKSAAQHGKHQNRIGEGHPEQERPIQSRKRHPFHVQKANFSFFARQMNPPGWAVKVPRSLTTDHWSKR